MTPEEIRALAIECGAFIYSSVGKGDIDFTPEQLEAYTAAVEANMRETLRTEMYTTEEYNEGQSLGFNAGEANMRERCANVLKLNNSEIMLMAGDMTAQELRSINAVLNALQGKIRSLK